MGFTKLFRSIVASSIWDTDAETSKVWVTLLALADQDGIVEAAEPGLATLSRVPLDKTLAALEAFSAPDPYSRSRDHDGRRVERIDGGFRLLNYRKYRDKRDPERRRQQNRQAKRRERARAREMTDQEMLNEFSEGGRGRNQDPT